MTVAPRVVLGLPARNAADQLPQALESVLGQTYGEFALLVVDDASTDGTADVLGRYAARDGRIELHRNGRALGLAGNWTRVFRLAREVHPKADLFAWVSDHDVWHAEWLEELVSALDERPERVLAYSLVRPISDRGTEVRVESRRFETDGVPDPAERLRRTMRRMSAGNMVYGLFRTDTLERCGALRSVLVADRLLLAQAAALGEFRQVPRFLWYRRYREGVVPTLARQRRSFFPDGAPLRSYVPWWISHAVVLFWSFALEGRGLPALGRLRAARLALLHLRLSILSELREQRIQRAKSLRRRRKQLRRTRRRAIGRVNSRVRGALR